MTANCQQNDCFESAMESVMDGYIAKQHDPETDAVDATLAVVSDENAISESML